MISDLSCLMLVALESIVKASLGINSRSGTLTGAGSKDSMKQGNSAHLMLRGESLDRLLGASTPLLGLALDQVGSDSFRPKAFVLRHL